MVDAINESDHQVALEWNSIPVKYARGDYTAWLQVENLEDGTMHWASWNKRHCRFTYGRSDALTEARRQYQIVYNVEGETIESPNGADIEDDWHRCKSC